MDQSTFTSLTGITPTTSQAARLSTVADLANESLEEMLGWPLNPDDWDNQYTEIGKVKTGSDWSSPDVDDLDPPDEVIGKTRVYDWNPADPYLFLDPAKVINSVKLVRNGVTYKTFDTNRYSLQLVNGRETFGRYLEMHHEVCSWVWGLPNEWPLFERRSGASFVQIAIDADWAFEDVPTQLQKVLADMIYYELDVIHRDIKSESILSHSYSRNAHADPTVTHATTLAKYAGPNGTATQIGVVL